MVTQADGVKMGQEHTPGLRGNAYKCAQVRSSCATFQEKPNGRDLKTYLNVDGEFYQLINPERLELSLDRNINMMQAGLR